MPSQKITKWNWTGQRLKAAEMVAKGEKTQEAIAKECGVRRETINIWNSQPEFKEKVVELVLLDERATKAGILQRALKTLEEKSKGAAGDKTTELDYLKFISDIQGHTKQGTDIQINNVEVNISEARERITSRINSIAARIGKEQTPE
jgi:DNA-binding XRE family transcriptional regulator